MVHLSKLYVSEAAALLNPIAIKVSTTLYFTGCFDVPIITAPDTKIMVIPHQFTIM